MADSSSFWYPDQPPPPKPVPPLLTPEEREVVKESLQYFYSVYQNCSGGVAIDKVKLIRSAAAALVITLEEY